MSRHYQKTFGRKVGNVCTTSIQFDKLFKENSNRPSAAKSAGTVGKWGITSFTSIRSSNAIGPNSGSGKAGGGKAGAGKAGGGKAAAVKATAGKAGVGKVGVGKCEPVVGIKRGRTDSQNSKSNDSFSFDNDSDSSAPPVIKPKKFFKSRNAEAATPATDVTKASSVASFGSNIVDDTDHPIQPMRTAASRKMMTRTPSPPATRPSSSSNTEEANKPPIVLRIFKGTSQLVSTTTTPTSPGNEFEVQLVEEHDIVKAPPVKAKQSSVPRNKKGGSKKERIPDIEDDDELLTVNTATSRAQRYSRRQAAAKETTLEMDSDSIPFIPTPKKAARYGYGRGIDKPLTTSTSDTSSGYGLYMSPEASASTDNPYSPQTVPASEGTENDDAASTDAPAMESSAQDESLDYSSAESLNVSNETDMSLPQPTSSAPPPALPSAIYDEENSESEMPSTENAGLEAASSEPEETAATYPPVSSFQVPPSYPSAPAFQQPVENYQLPPPYDHTSSYQQPDVNYQATESYEAPTSSYQAAASSEPDEPLEHMTARQRFDRRNRQAMESHQAPQSMANHIEHSSLETRSQQSPDHEMHSSNMGSVDCDPIDSANSVIANSALASRNVYDDGPDAFDGYPGSSGEPSANHEVSDSIESYSSAVVVPRKKGSIFKSRAHGTDENKKRLALYKHKWSDNQEGAPGASQPGSNVEQAETNASASLAKPSTSAYNVDDEFGPDELTRVTEQKVEDESVEPVTTVKCAKNAKGYYTVVRNVKKAHQIQESGEFQEFNDDVEYILDALQEQNPIGTRCLSAITLASKCMVPAFRMHVRAHGTVAKFFKALHDAARDQSLGLCTATVMFALSQDRLNMDLDRDSLELMLNLLESDASHLNALEDCGLSSSQLLKNKLKVRELCAEIQSQGHAKHLNLDNITVGQLAMETLLSLTSRRAGEWFKEELRELGGLEHIVKTICQCCVQIDDYVVEWTDALLDRMRKIDRCLRVLENVTQENEENQVYLLKYQNASLVDVLVRLLRLCGNEVPLYPVFDPADKDSTGVVLREALFAVLKVLINLSHDFKALTYGSTLVGSKNGMLESSLHMLLHIPNYVVENSKFDLIVLALTLMINLMEHNVDNRLRLLRTKAPAEVESNQKSAIEALIAMFYRQEEFARSEEAKTDAILDGKDTAEDSEKSKEAEKDKDKPKTVQANKTQDEQIEETVAKLLAKAGRHMEHTFVAAYIGLLLGYVIMNNQEHEEMVRRMLPEGDFKTMVAVLKKFFNFMSLTVTATGSSRGLSATETVLKYMEKLDEPPREEELKSEGDLPSDLDGSMES
ncbi:wings apart-like protein homolog 1 isoform X2 [Thrips palmi]|uniref:Wings apart-like protein homolog 1 isoform X2 n=1 Tax=Thrips palmi TaxID=161013 RepID=A0A6P8YUU9_THRPL|nr:wings apart-like protein homolog 1 isoform X2 [Thrips palmi]